MADEDSNKKEQPIIIKKIKKGGHGHHGGAWKVAYADFVTAMMAFFLLMWLLNATTEEQKTGIADYFSPSTDPLAPRVSVTLSGAESLLAGQSVAREGAMVTDLMPLVNTPELTNVDVQNEAAEQESFNEVEAELKQAMQDDPELADLAPNLIVDEAPEGLRIQIVDQEGQSMFPSGSARMYPRMRKLLERVAKIIEKADNQISVRGHTDSVPYRGRDGYSNWELSADRANSSRKVLLSSGLAPKRLDDVVGKADTEHLFPDDPRSAKNRRISIILIKDSITEAKKGGDGSKGRTYLDQLRSRPRSNTIFNIE